MSKKMTKRQMVRKIYAQDRDHIHEPYWSFNYFWSYYRPMTVAEIKKYLPAYL